MRRIHRGQNHTLTTRRTTRRDRYYRRKLLVYARNMIQTLDLTEDLLNFVIPLLPQRSKGVLRNILTIDNDTPGDSGRMPGSDKAIVARIIEMSELPDGDSMVARIQEELQRLLELAIKARKYAALPAGGLAVKRVFSLSRQELELLMTVVAYQVNRELEIYLDSLSGTSKVSALSAMTGLSVAEVMSCGGRHGKLVQCGLLEPASLTETHRFFKTNDDILECILGLNQKPLVHKLCRRIDGVVYPPEAFDLPEPSLTIIKALLQAGEPCNIFLYGEPGTGKTEFARSIVSACGKSAYFVQNGESGANEDRRMALVAAVNTLPPAKGVVVVDESDGMLNTRYAFQGAGGKDALRKEWLNEFLEGCPAQIIWISNDIASIEQSTRRRFTYAVEFKRNSIRQRRQVWETHIASHPLNKLLDSRQIDCLSREYKVNAGIIGNALDAMRRMPSSADGKPETAMAALRELLACHERLAGDRRTMPNQVASTAEYDPDAINTSIPPDEIVRNLQSYIANRQVEPRIPANVLFWGEPGTGKTAFAQHIARALDMELMTKRASDLLSMWVGGTEQNIRQTFEEVGSENAVLLLDEADSFFIDRRTAVRSWETTTTNELLTQMENHHGILICCTNLVDDLDHAAMRRFCWKVRFRPLELDGRMRLFRRYFPEVADSFPESVLRSRLDKLPWITPGDMRVVSSQYRLRIDRPADWETIFTALAQESAYRKNVPGAIGFCKHP